MTSIGGDVFIRLSFGERTTQHSPPPGRFGHVTEQYPVVQDAGRKDPNHCTLLFNAESDQDGEVEGWCESAVGDR
jgi:hypothetical protein